MNHLPEPAQRLSAQVPISHSKTLSQSQSSLSPVSGQTQSSLRSVTGQSQASLRPVKDQSEVSQRSVSGQSQAIAMNAVWVLITDNEPPARACMAFKCTDSYISLQGSQPRVSNRRTRPPEVVIIVV